MAMLSRSRSSLLPSRFLFTRFSSSSSPSSSTNVSFGPPPSVPSRRVVVTGLGMVTPLGCGVEATWKRLIVGECGVRAITPQDLKMSEFDKETRLHTFDQLTSKVAATVPCGTNSDQFNEEIWLNSKEERSISRFVGYALCAANEALRDANWMPTEEEEKEKTGVSIGGGIGSISDILDASKLICEKRVRRLSPFFIPRILINMAAGHVSIKYGFQGPNHAAVTACATGGHAIGDATRMIQFGDADVMVAGGTESSIDALSIAGFCRSRALSTKYNATPEHASCPFDCGRDGFVIGEGAGVMVLEQAQLSLSPSPRPYSHWSKGPSHTLCSLSLPKSGHQLDPFLRSQTNPNPRKEMDDTCAVCAETLEWATYGQCGHREVCSTCIARLRFICDDRRCCICKSESSIVFVTKALGDYTRMINDFSILPVDPTEGQVGPFWYHEGTQAFFEDFDHYKMIAAMCKLSCVVCDKKDEQGSEGPIRRIKFRNIEQLKSHLFHQHKLFTCILCLEGRKMFICEQKLYSRTQLNRHISMGDSEVDGCESERGGFKGHPSCEFCQNPFYGDTELYTHMSTEHYTCHICQRQRPEQYDYYRNYDDLEIHFRREHFLCENEACLAKKFIVFPNEPEMKRHNAMEHGGHMSRSKRNAALQIPISFQYWRSREQDQTRRRHGLHFDSSESELSSAIQASLETANAYVPRATSSRAHADSDHRETSEIDPICGSFGLLASADSGSSSSNAPLEESSFPPLPVAARSSPQKTKKYSKGLGRTTMASHLRHQNNVIVLNTSQVWPTATHHLSSHGGSSSLQRSMSNAGHVSSSGLSSSSTMMKSTSKITHSASSTSKLLHCGSVDHPISTSPAGSTTHSNILTGNNKNLANVEDIKNANKSLVERIRVDLECDEDRFAAFKLISKEYRRGIVDTGEYLAYVHQFGLAHHVLELARLCPDAQKQKELLEACSGSLRSNGPLENKSLNSSSPLKLKKSSKKGKEKCRDDGIGGSNGALVDSIVNSARELQLNHKPSKSDEPTTSVSGNQTLYEMRVQTHSQSTVDGSKNTLGTKAGGNKLRKKTLKFLRARVGESSSAAALNLTNSVGRPDRTNKGQSDDNTSGGLEALPVRGAWKNGGGKRLVGQLAMTR